MLKIYTADNGKYLEKRYNEAMTDLKKSGDYPYICGQLENMIEAVIDELKQH